MAEAATVVYELRGEQFKWEQKDCAVIALSKLTGLTYAQANQLMTLSGRRYRKGVNLNKILEFIRTNHEFLSILGVQVEGYQFLPVTNPPMSIGHLKANSCDYPGRYLVKVYGHCFAMIEGQITDLCSDHIAIEAMWEFKDLSNWNEAVDLTIKNFKEN